MAAAPMEAQTAQPPSDPSAAAAAAAYPRWVLLQHDKEIVVDGSSRRTSSDSKTLAAARTSTGHLIQVSLRLTEPPGVSCVCLHLPAGLDAKFSNVIAAHGDSVLIEVPHSHTTDYFVYSAGGATATTTNRPRPPSMSLLPPSPLGRLSRPKALVRRGEDVVVATQLIGVSAERDDAPEELVREACLALFRSGQWSFKRLQIMYHDASVVPKNDPNFGHAVVPVGDGLLCWVDLWQLGVVLLDVFDVEETSGLRYIPLPRGNNWGMPSNRNVCATAGGDMLKYVSVFPRCCCGGAGVSSCKRSCHAYTIQTWTMRIGGGDDMEWVMDGVVDSTELWALDSYKGLRRLPLNHPVMSLDQPELICFWLHEPPEDGYGDRYGDTTVDTLMVNMRSKRIHSVSRYVNGLFHRGHGLIPSNVSCFFNYYKGCGSDDATFTEQRQDDIGMPPPDNVDEQLIREDEDDRNQTKLAPPFAEPSASEIFQAYQEISSYGLDRDDELKVHRILSHDNCRRFISLLRLPKNLRKDWLLMDIKASEDY